MDWINKDLESKEAVIIGEVSKVSEREKAIYFSIKDPQDGAVLNCLVWRFRYNMMGIKLEEGMQVKVLGAANVYKPMGSLSFKANAIELAGEGALKKAYEALKKKLEGEGVFAAERKRRIKKFPKKIGLITSKYGDAIHDFNTNIARAGFEIKFLDCRMEGSQAVPDIIKSIEYFNNNFSDLDCIILTRGGGSWESLQAFNNEAAVRAVFCSKIPILCGIGHEKDVPLACLAADKSVSTPTAAAEFLSASWKAARHESAALKEKILACFLREISQKKYALENLRNIIGGRFSSLLENIRYKVMSAEQKLRDNNPQRLLDLGYSLAFKSGRLIGSAKDLSTGDNIDIVFKDGGAGAEIKELKWKRE